MRIYAKPILNFMSVNSFSYGNQWIIRSGDPNTLYFQLVDLDQSSLRYMAGIGVSNQPASVVVTFPSIDDSLELNIAAVQDSNDKSIWSVTIGTTQLPNSGNVIFSLTEGSSTRKFSVLNMLSVEYINNGAC